MPPVNNSGAWRYIALFFLGILLVDTTLGLALYNEPSRIFINDLVVGSAVSFLALWSIFKPRTWIDWLFASIGLYLILSPTLLWAKTSETFVSDNLIGALIFSLAVLFSPEETASAKGGTPQGWNFNPSEYGQRLPVIFLAFVAYLCSRYMAFYQLGYIPVIEDPVFGDGTHAVITSSISQAMPVPDAGLGSWVYAVEVLMGIHGSKKRWHTLPWFVTFFAILVIPAGLVSVLLITLQPLVVGAYCFWCLLTALAMLFMIVFAADEVVATILFLRSVKRRGQDVTRAFWHGDLSYESHEEKENNGFRLFYGVSFSWNLILLSLIGFWMMFFQSTYFDPESIQAISATVGALTIAFSIIPFAEVLRPVRFVNTLLGIVFMILAFYSEGAGIYYHLILGIAMILLSIPKGKIHYAYGEWY